MNTIKVTKNGGEVPVNSIINQNGGGLLKLWYGTEQQYLALTSVDANTIYLIKEVTVS